MCCFPSVCPGRLRCSLVRTPTALCFQCLSNAVQLPCWALALISFCPVYVLSVCPSLLFLAILFTRHSRPVFYALHCARLYRSAARSPADRCTPGDRVRFHYNDYCNTVGIQSLYTVIIMASTPILLPGTRTTAQAR